MESLQQTIIDLHKKGQTPSEINQQLFQKTYPIIKFSNREWDTIHIVTSVVFDFESRKNQCIQPRANTLGILRKGNAFLLEQQFVRHSKGDGPFYRPLGGTIELGETSVAALKREFKEEIDAEIRVGRYMDVLENIYALNKRVFHEISLVYEVEFVDSEQLQRESFEVTEGSKKTLAKWVSLGELALEETTLYPDGLLALLQQLPEPAQTKT
ncbi:NUDIX domain-containing protein [Planococcus sp. APC 3900]|uniref:NUDIX hydrolase n=1 Tax=Planococcus sp. APC 3900 TaxID=3035191 RepID=UPI0033ACBE74